MTTETPTPPPVPMRQIHVIERRRRRMTRAAVVWMMIGSVVFGVGSFGFVIGTAGAWTQASAAHATAVTQKQSADAKEAAAEAAQAAAAAAAQKEADAKAAADKAAEAAGFSVSPNADGEVFYKGVSGDLQCSYYEIPCGFMQISVAIDCPSGVYVAANLDVGSQVIGKGNAITGALDPQHTTEIEVDFPSTPNDAGAKWDVTDAHCM